MTSSSEIRGLIQEAIGDLVRMRRHLHQNPESAFEEANTAALIREELTRLQVPFQAGLAGGNGTVAHLAGGAAGAQSIGLRADIDALPMPDLSPCAWRSRISGRAHACGHDGHTVMLLGAARVLSQLAKKSPLPNPVTFIFQPAEETGMGAGRMVQDGALDGSRIGTPVKRIYGMHAWPTVEVGCVASRPGPMLASADSFEVTVRGRGSHAAWPHLSADPVVAAAAIVQALQTIVSRRTDPLDAAVVTVTAVHAGSAFNVIPPDAVLRGTFRALRQPVREQLQQSIQFICENVAVAHGVTASVHFLHGTPATSNDAETFDRFRRIARDALGGDKVRPMPNPVMGAEDFSVYGQVVKACFFTLGQMRPNEPFPPLHDPAFDFNDDSIATGVEMFCHLALDRDEAAPR